MTLTMVPSRTIVDSASMIEDRLSPRKSVETSGSSLTPRIPFSGPSAAVRNAALSSSTDVGRATSAVKSTTLTVGVGTRRLKPSNLPFRSGITRASAFAAPVVVGRMFWPALRAGGDVPPRLVGVGEEAGRLEHDVHAQVAPRQCRRVPLRQDLDLVTVDDQ